MGFIRPFIALFDILGLFRVILADFGGNFGHFLRFMRFFEIWAKNEIF